MTASRETRSAPRPALLCFDGSSNAADGITAAGELLDTNGATVLTVWEPVEIWEPYDPGAIVSAGVSRLGSKALGLDEIATEAANATMERGLELARAGGFDVHGKVAHGKTWKAICDTADTLDAAVIVLGARGLSRVQSVLLGSVSAAVVAHCERAVLIVPKQSGRGAGTE